MSQTPIPTMLSRILFIVVFAAGVALCHFGDPGLRAQDGPWLPPADDFDIEGANVPTVRTPPVGNDPLKVADENPFARLPVDPINPITADEKLEILAMAEKAFFDKTPLPVLDMYRSAVVLSEASNLANVLDATLYRISEIPMSNKQKFEIVERLGTRKLTEIPLAPGMGKHMKLINDLFTGAVRHLDSRTPLEKIMLHENPRTPLEFMEAAAVIQEAGRPEIARRLLTRLKDAIPSDAECADIVDKVGSYRLFEIAQNEELKPNGRTVVNMIYEGAKKYWSNPDRISKAIEVLCEKAGADGNGKLDEASFGAVSAIWQGGETSITLLLERLGTSDDPAHLREIKALLISMKDESQDAIMTAFRSDDEKLALHSAEILGGILPRNELIVLFSGMLRDDFSPKTRDAIASIYTENAGRIPDHETSAKLMYRRAEILYKKEAIPRSDENRMVSAWSWNAEGTEIQKRKIPLAEAILRNAHLAAWDAFRAAPENKKIRRLYLVSLFERAAFENGLDNPIEVSSDPILSGAAELLESIGIPELGSIILETMDTEHSPCALTAIALIGRLSPKPETLLAVDSSGPGRRPYSPIVCALASSDTRVRFAALSLIMALDPKKAYPGSSLTAEALLHFAKSDGVSKAIVGSPVNSEGMRLTGSLHDLGYAGETVYHNRSLMLAASSSPDIELILLDTKCTNPPYQAFLQEISRNHHTALIPVALITTEAELLRNDPITEPIPLTPPLYRKIFASNALNYNALIFPYPLTEDAVLKTVRDLVYLSGANPVPADIRLENAKTSLDWIIGIVKRQSEKGGAKIYHFEDIDIFAIETMHRTSHTLRGIELASLLRSVDCQAQLAEMSMQAMFPISIRQKSAERFEENLDRFGILLKGTQITNIYDRYNASEVESKESQAVLGRLLDLVEKHAPKSDKKELPRTW